jgi:hypothetical protein
VIAHVLAGQPEALGQFRRAGKFDFKADGFLPGLHDKVKFRARGGAVETDASILGATPSLFDHKPFPEAPVMLWPIRSFRVWFAAARAMGAIAM